MGLELPILLRNLRDDAVIEFRSAQTGAIRRGWVVFSLVVPIGVGIATFVLGSDDLKASTLFPAAAIFAGALTGTASMLFTRVKDLTGKPRPEVGRDPVYQASVVFRSALYCTEVAFAVNAVLVAAALLPQGPASRAFVSIAIALVVHMGMKVIMLLQGLRAQMFDAAGSRTQAPIARTTTRAS